MTCLREFRSLLQITTIETLGSFTFRHEGYVINFFIMEKKGEGPHPLYHENKWVGYKQQPVHNENTLLVHIIYRQI